MVVASVGPAWVAVAGGRVCVCPRLTPGFKPYFEGEGGRDGRPWVESSM
jgi:hypothetical protein